MGESQIPTTMLVLLHSSSSAAAVVVTSPAGIRTVCGRHLFTFDIGVSLPVPRGPRRRCNSHGNTVSRAYWPSV
jgi:hypothetical protein